MRACARCGQEFNPRPTGRRAGRPRTQCDTCRIPKKLGVTAANCQRCGEEFNPVKPGIAFGRLRMYCDSCRYPIYGRVKSLPKAKSRPLLCCYQCGLDFVGAKVSQKFCSLKCGGKFYSDEYTMLRRLARTCNTCHEPLGNLFRKVTCDLCQRENRLKVWARKNHKRRTTGKLPSKLEVVERWGNRCHLCEKKIDLALSGKNPRGFTFDHVIPVSMGGTNDAENIRPAHWICNTRRGNRGPVQLDLGMCG
jgi:hypothetical protein